MPKLLVTLGAVLIALGLLWPLLSKLGIGRLPGDVVLERGKFTLYVPLATCVLISALLTLLFWLLRK